MVFFLAIFVLWQEMSSVWRERLSTGQVHLGRSKFGRIQSTGCMTETKKCYAPITTTTGEPSMVALSMLNISKMLGALYGENQNVGKSRIFITTWAWLALNLMAWAFSTLTLNFLTLRALPQNSLLWSGSALAENPNMTETLTVFQNKSFLSPRWVRIRRKCSCNSDKLSQWVADALSLNDGNSVLLESDFAARYFYVRLIRWKTSQKCM